MLKENAIYLIKDVARLSGFSIHTVKYYLRIGLVREVGRSPETNYRFFDETTLERLKEICSMRRSGKGLHEIQGEISSRR